VREGESKEAEECTQGPPETQTGKRRPSKSTTGQPDQAATRQERGAGKAEDRGGEGCTNHIRIAIVQLSGVQYGNWIIIMMNTSVWPTKLPDITSDMV